MSFSASHSRRRFIRNSALTCGAIAVAGSAADAFASVPVVTQFDLNTHKDDQYYPTNSIKLTYDSGHQLASFAIDSVNKWVFVAQNVGGNTLGITKVQMGSNTVLGHMYITNAGHGNQIGVDVNGTTNHVWVESHPNSSGLGTQLSRVWFSNGATTDASAMPTGYTFNLVPGSTQNTCSLDTICNRMVLRYVDPNGVYRFNLYDFAAVVGGSPSVLASVIHPSTQAIGNYYSSSEDYTQGFVAYGNYLYILRGRSYANNCSPIDSTDKGNITFSAVDFNTGVVTQDHVLLTWGKSLWYREPEGAGLYVADINNPTTSVKLCAGISSFNVCGTPTIKYANIYGQPI